MTDQENNFLTDIQETVEPEVEKSVMSEENREAIEYLAEQIKQLKNSEKKQVDSRENNRVLKELQSLREEVKDSGRSEQLDHVQEETKHARTAMEKLAEIQTDVILELEQFSDLLETFVQENDLKSAEEIEVDEEKLSSEDVKVATPDGESEHDDSVEEAVDEENLEYECPICGKKYEQEYYYREHVKDCVKDEEDSSDEQEIGDIGVSDRERRTFEKLEKNIYKSSSEIRDELDESISKRTVQDRLATFRDAGYVVSSKGRGYKLTEQGALLLNNPSQSSKKQGKTYPFECIACGKSFQDGRGFGGHLRHVHDLGDSDAEDEKPTDLFNARNKTEQEIKELKKSVGKLELPQDVEKEIKFPLWEEGEKIEDAQHWSVEERKPLTKQILKEADKPLTRSEVAKRMYNLDSEPKFGDSYYNCVSTYIKEMVDSGELVEADRTDVDRKKCYALPGSPQATTLGDTDTDTDTDKDIEEQVEETKVSDATHILDQKNGVSGRREFNFYINTFTKLIHKEEKEEITYYDFSEHYGGDQKPLDAFQTIFQNPTVLNALREKVCPMKSFSWKSRGKGGRPSNWVLEVG